MVVLFVCALLGGDKLGTALEWESSIEEAAALAARENRLVMVLHVSGEFDKPEFT